MAELFVTNFNPRFTGVSATIAGLLPHQAGPFDLALVGHALAGGPDPITKKRAVALSRSAPQGRPFAIWHVRRNPEMQTALWARDVLRLPIRIVFTSAAQRRHSAWPRFLISRMDAVIATTDAAADFVPHVRAVVPHGVDTDRFTPAQDRAAAWAATGFPGQRGIATIGRIRPEKGTDRFVTAMIRALPDLPGTTALVIGRATSKHQTFLNTLKSQVAAAGLSDRILFPGERPADEQPALLRALSLVIQLPRYEGYGMVPLEAMASATPLIATDAGFYRHFTQSDQNGLITNPENADTAVRAVLGDPDRHAAMAQHARRDAQSLFSITREAAGIADVYHQLWQQNPSR